MLQNTRKSAWRRSALLLVAAVLVMTVLAACGNKTDGHSLDFAGTDTGETVATYKDGKVTQPEFDKYLDIFGVSQPTYAQILEIPEFQEMILQQYISYKILAHRANEDALKLANVEVDKQMEIYKGLLETEAEMKASVEAAGVTEADMATFLLLTSAVIEHMNSLVTEEDITATFEKMQADFAVSDVRHILVETAKTDPTTGAKTETRTQEEALARANEVKAKLDAGGDWAALAKEYSDDPGSADTGGLYEGNPGNKWVEPFKIAAYEQEIGVVGEPVLSDFGYHVIKVEKRDVKTYDQLTDEEKDMVKNTAAYNYMELFMNDEMPSQEIEITLPKPEVPEGEDATDGAAEGTDEGATESEVPASTDGAAK